VTAAKGAEPFYSLANNDTRTETVEVARAVRRRPFWCILMFCGLIKSRD